MNRDDIAERLESFGVMPTPQRLDVGEIVLSRPQHASADQILAGIRAMGSKISKATVYNTLHQFTAAGLLREVAIEGSKTYFDTNTSDHCHFFLESEGALEDIPREMIEISRLPEPPAGMKISRVDVLVRLVEQD